MAVARGSFGSPDVATLEAMPTQPVLEVAISEMRGAMKPRGMLIPHANQEGGLLGSYVRRAMLAVVLGRFVSHRLVPFSASSDATMLITMRDLIDDGAVRPVLDAPDRWRDRRCHSSLCRGSGLRQGRDTNERGLTWTTLA